MEILYFLYDKLYPLTMRLPNGMGIRILLGWVSRALKGAVTTSPGICTPCVWLAAGGVHRSQAARVSRTLHVRCCALGLSSILGYFYCTIVCFTHKSCCVLSQLPINVDLRKQTMTHGFAGINIFHLFFFLSVQPLCNMKF